jgi:monoamine oxidase
VTGSVTAPTSPVKFDAVVVGAGFAGLSAARRLAQANLRVRVLEASDRVGGRARTDYTLAGVPLELGAQMVHGRRAATHAWIHRTGLHSRPLPVAQRSRLVVDRRVASYPWLALPFHPVVGTRATWAGLRRVPAELAAVTTPDRSLDDFLSERRLAPATRLLVTLLHAHAAAVDPEAIGVVGPAEEARVAREPFGFRNFRLVEGYSALAERAAAELGDRVQLGTPVTEIDYANPGVRLRATSPAGQLSEYSAAAAIVTVPLGVLRADRIAFDPPLPEAKRAAIVRIGFADAFAVQLKVQGGAWRSRLGDFSLVWGGTPSSFLRPRVGLGETPELLTGFTVGREARRRAGLSDAELVEATREEWADLLPGGVRLGAIDGSRVHRWPIDPCTLGAYSFLPPGTGLADRRALAAPVGERLYFAGEATEFNGHAATVDGAIESGERAADELLAALRTPGRSGAPRR